AKAAAPTPPKHKKDKGVPAPIKKPVAEDTSGLSYGLDIVLPVGLFILAWVLSVVLYPSRSGFDMNMFLAVAFLLPLGISCLFFARPICYGLTLAGILAVHAIYAAAHDSQTVYSDRSYFGILRVKEQSEMDRNDKGEAVRKDTYTTLIHGHINHGMN